ncbi:MAG: hypothetical protein GY772_00855 [bacterium]|nr:hypothetical protein [bacterium]
MGTSVVYKAALASRRKVWVSDEFILDHKPAARILVAALEHHPNKWCLLRHRAEFLEKARAAVRRGKTFETIALVSTREAAALRLPQAFDMQAFLLWAGQAQDVV